MALKLFKKYTKGFSLPKLVGVGIVALIALIIALWLIGFAFRVAFVGPERGFDQRGIFNQKAEFVATEDFALGRGVSIQPIFPPPIGDGFSTGTDAESFEITEYNGSIKTGKLEETCDILEDLKVHEYVIFESASRYDHGCSYTFKVENDKVDKVLPIILSLNPETFQATTRTIKRAIEGFDSEIDIQKKRLVSVEETLRDAQRAYSEVERLATNAQDIESLAKIIDSKLNLIEKLTSQRISIKSQIDRLTKAQLDQTDRLNFTFFNISVREIVIVDFERIKDSWVFELKNFVQEVNRAAQGVTINLLGWILKLVQVALYFIIALFVIKYGWRLTKYLWKF